jgi:hypothetical protein
LSSAYSHHVTHGASHELRIHAQHPLHVSLLPPLPPPPHLRSLIGPQPLPWPLPIIPSPHRPTQLIRLYLVKIQSDQAGTNVNGHIFCNHNFCINIPPAGVAQLVERVALMTAKRSTSRSWVRAPPSAIPISKLIRAAVLLYFYISDVRNMVIVQEKSSCSVVGLHFCPCCCCVTMATNSVWTIYLSCGSHLSHARMIEAGYDVLLAGLHAYNQSCVCLCC